jgi:demethylmenaquinone methyltransferase/2-methoxy-6-polyprenyl-1,4-benzoquinol methylase
VQRYYDKIAGVYDLLAERSESPVREAGLRKLSVGQSERVLEIGCGTGHSLVELARTVGRSGRVCGVDLSEKMLFESRRRLSEVAPAAEVQLARSDAAMLPYEDVFFDGVFMSFTLELFDTPEIPLVLEECRRVLKKGGRIAVVGVSKEPSTDKAVRVFEWTHRHFPNLLDCRPIYVARSISDAGFQVLEKDIESMWVPVEIVLARRP